MTLPFENDTSRIVKRLAKQNMKANRRTSISIMVAILIASTFLCSLCTFVQSYWNQSVQQEIAAYGDWDAQLLEIHAGQLDLIQNNENIQTIMVKGDNQTALLPAASGLPYLLIQNCDGAYWGGMREKNLILRGRVPGSAGLQSQQMDSTQKSFFQPQSLPAPGRTQDWKYNCGFSFPHSKRGRICENRKSAVHHRW